MDATWAIDGKGVLAFTHVSDKRYERKMKKRIEGKSQMNLKARIGRNVEDDWYNIAPDLYKKTHMELKIYM